MQRLKVKRMQEARLPDSGLGQEAAEDQGRELTGPRSQVLERRDVSSTAGVSVTF